MADEPPSISPYDSFWIECDERHDPHPVALLSCRRCGVHHVIDRDPDDNPLTLAAVIALANEHGWVCHDDSLVVGQRRRHGDGALTVVGFDDDDRYVWTESATRGREIWARWNLQRFPILEAESD